MAEMTVTDFAAASASVPSPALLQQATAEARGQVRNACGWWSRIDAGVKRMLDVAVATMALLLLSPLLALIALLVRVDSPGPIFYRATRVGHHGRTLRMLKFRKMRDGASGIPLTLQDDARFTSIGRTLAQLKLDELPQLWHVLTGEMSLVGPRPETLRFAALQSADYGRILTVRPGIFGWSQLAFAEENRVLDAADPLGHYVGRILPQKVSLDTMYADRRTLAIDLRIVAWSVLAVVARRPVAVDRRNGRMRLRKRSDA